MHNNKNISSSPFLFWPHPFPTSDAAPSVATSLPRPLRQPWPHPSSVPPLHSFRCPIMGKFPWQCSSGHQWGCPSSWSRPLTPRFPAPQLMFRLKPCSQLCMFPIFYVKLGLGILSGATMFLSSPASSFGHLASPSVPPGTPVCCKAKGRICF